MTRKNILTKEQIEEWFTVDVNNGIVYWKKVYTTHRGGHVVSIGDVAGTIHRTQNKYEKYRWTIKLNKKDYYKSYIIWVYYTGNQPMNQLDHINGDSSDDRIFNLRESTSMQNNRNRKNNTRCHQLPMGVYLTTNNKIHKYRSKIIVDKKEKTLGYYLTPEEASEAYQQARIKYFGEFA